MPINSRAILATLLVSVAFTASATPDPRDATDLWIAPAESGWGLNIFHQGDTLFASLFVYGPDGQPRWYTGSALTGGGAAYSGPLTESAGPWFGGAFDPARVTRRTVGTMTVTLGQDSATVDYTIDGVRVTKQVSRFTFHPTTLDGSFVGYTYERQSGGFQIRRDQVMSITDDGANVTMLTQSASEGSCTWTGPHRQDGQLEIVSGTYTCGSRTGSWSMTADPTTEGFTGMFSGDELQAGRIAAVRRDASRMLGNGYRNELWFPPNEGGWGLNTIEQGNTLFGTLFVYDTQGNAHWYSASNLDRSDVSGDTVTYAGPLIESTGPYYGTSFNAAAVTRRTVGSMTLTTRTDGMASLSYSVDGVSVQKEVTRFAFRKQGFSGTYAAHLSADNSGGDQPIDTVTIDDNENFVMQTITNGVTCSYLAPVFQTGHLRVMQGTYTCTNARSGNFTMSNAIVSANGFTARMRIDPGFSGRMEGVRLGSF
jgi:hypothetical protein